MNVGVEARLEALGPWYHSVRVGDYTTPGKVDPAHRATLTLATLPGDLAGRTVVDIGGNCGAVALEFAKRGARATVLEVSEHYLAQGRALAEILGLEVRFERGEVYDLPRLGEFDYVVFFGLVYHLRHPFLAIDMVRSATRARAFISTRVSTSHHRVWSIGNVMGGKRGSGGEAAYNWWLPSVVGMEETLRVYGFRDVQRLELDEDRSEGFWSAAPGRRIAVRDLVASAWRPGPDVPGWTDRARASADRLTGRLSRRARRLVRRLTKRR